MKSFSVFLTTRLKVELIREQKARERLDLAANMILRSN